MTAGQVASSLSTLFVELVEGPPGKASYVLNQGDTGLLRSLDSLSAEAASRSTADGATIAAHVDHVLYGLTLMNRWSEGERNPWEGADWTRSWQRAGVSENEWSALRADLARESRRWLAALREPRETNEIELTGLVSSVVHIAYHLGAIRQIDRSARGPKA